MRRPLRTSFASAVGVAQRRRASDPWADAALAVHPVALGADARPLLLAQLARARVLLGPALLEPRVERGWRHDLDRGEHLRVLEPAELGALARVRPLVVGLEPRVVRPTGDRVDLPAERGDPPGVDDVSVGRAHDEPNRHAGRRAHVVDRDGAVRILVLPVELAAGHLDLELLLAGGRVGDVLDPRQLDEDERPDDEEHDDRELPSTRARASSRRGSARRPRSAGASGVGTSRGTRSGAPRRARRSRR